MGKIEKNGWRNQLFEIRDSPHDVDRPQLSDWPEVSIPGLPGAVYVGPHFLGDDHGCYHGEGTHGVAAGGDACGGAYPGLTRPDVANRCLTALESATHVFGWIDDCSVYGSLVEIGYAKSLGKQIHLYFDQNKDLGDLWFASQISTSISTSGGALEAWADFCVRIFGPSAVK